MLLVVFKNDKKKRIIFTSSMSVYGNYIKAVTELINVIKIFAWFIKTIFGKLHKVFY